MATKTDAPQALNLDALAASVAAQVEGREIDILDPDNKPVGLKITVAGVDSERYRIAWRAEIKALADEGSLESLSPERDAESKRRIAAACTMALSPPRVEFGGKSYGIENVVEVYKAIPTIFDQVYGAVLYRAGFTKH